MFEDGKCPFLFSDVIEKYRLSNDFVKKFCDLGCSPKCGEFLKEELEKKGIIKEDTKSSTHD